MVAGVPGGGIGELSAVVSADASVSALVTIVVSGIVSPAGVGSVTTVPPGSAVRLGSSCADPTPLMRGIDEKRQYR